MGQKIDPRGFRLVITKDWSSRWFASTNNFAGILLEDIKIRAYLMKKYGRRAAIGRVLIERPAKSIKVTVFTARPGVLIGKKGEGIEQIKLELQKMTKVPLQYCISSCNEKSYANHIKSWSNWCKNHVVWSLKWYRYCS